MRWAISLGVVANLVFCSALGRRVTAGRDLLGRGICTHNQEEVHYSEVMLRVASQFHTGVFRLKGEKKKPNLEVKCVLL